MIDTERDVRILEAMADQMHPYLIEQELLWPIAGPGTSDMPRLTIGGFLFRRHRLLALHDALTPAQQERLDATLVKWQTTRKEWSLHYDQKLIREWDMRVNLLAGFLDDCEEEGRTSCSSQWPIQAEHRTILYHVQDEATDRAVDGLDKSTLSRVDRGLRRYLLSGEGDNFLWDDDLAVAYPRSVYWWLWVRPYEHDD
ncbi:MAG: hypothetical protein JW910_14215 [Anaerolineae bacterium]|nr:hypothetical protein [Anaerolineae bacterium]